MNRRVLLVAVGGLVLGVCPSARASLRVRACTACPAWCHNAATR